MRNNKIKKLSEFQKLQCLPNLEVLIVKGNPLPGADQAHQQGGEDFGEGGRPKDIVLITLLCLLPHLKRVNKTVVSVEDRIDAEDMSGDIMEAMLGGGVDESNEETDLEGTTTDVTTDYKTESESERF